MGVVAPLAAQHLDRDDGARARIVRAVDAAEAARGDLVEYTVTAQEETVRIVLEELLALPRSQITLALKRQDQRLRVIADRSGFVQAFLKLIQRYQSKTNGFLAQGGGVNICHFHQVQQAAKVAWPPLHHDFNLT